MAPDLPASAYLHRVDRAQRLLAGSLNERSQLSQQRVQVVVPESEGDDGEFGRWGLEGLPEVCQFSTPISQQENHTPAAR